MLVKLTEISEDLEQCEVAGCQIQNLLSRRDLKFLIQRLFIFLKMHWNQYQVLCTVLTDVLQEDLTIELRPALWGGRNSVCQLSQFFHQFFHTRGSLCSNSWVFCPSCCSGFVVPIPAATLDVSKVQFLKTVWGKNTHTRNNLKMAKRGPFQKLFLVRSDTRQAYFPLIWQTWPYCSPYSTDLRYRSISLENRETLLTWDWQWGNASLCPSKS